MPNIVTNPSFEAGLAGWNFTNVTIDNTNPFEGNASARMGSGVATLFQDITIDDKHKSSFLFSFAVESPLVLNPGNLSVLVQWLNEHNKIIGTGLSLFVPSVTSGLQLFWLTYDDVTNFAPKHTEKVRILFSKAAGTSPNDVLDIDLVVLAKINQKEKCEHDRDDEDDKD